MILMDIELAGSELTGIEITAIIKGTYKGLVPNYAANFEKMDNIPVIFVTAYASAYSESELKAAGGADIITKPVNFTTLGFVVANLIAKKILKE